MDFKALKDSMELLEKLLEKSPSLHRLAWAVIAVTALFGLASLITAIRWW